MVLRFERRKLLLLVLTSLLAVILGTWTFSPQMSVKLFGCCGYYLTLAAVAAFGFYLFRLIPWRSLRRRWNLGGWRVAVLVGVSTAALHVQERHGFKVVMDEIVQLSTSKRLYETRDASIVRRGYNFGFKFVAMQGHPDKRPLLYPFLLSLVHDFTGYRPENAFLLNALLTPILLGLVYLVGQRVSGMAGGMISVLLFATLPLLAQTVTGGGFEVLNLTMIALTIVLGMVYAEQPTTDSLACFCLSGILLAQVRYESVLFVVPVAIVIAWTAWRNRFIDLPWIVVLCPLLLVHYLWQHKLMQLMPTLWQLADHPSRYGVFSYHYFYDNIGHALNYFLSFDRAMANSHLLFVAGVFGAGFFWLIVYRRHRAIWDNPNETVFVVFCLSLFGVAVLLLCYFWGAMDDVLTVRLSLPAQLLMVWLFAYAWPRIVGAKPRWPALGGACVIYFLAWTVPTLHVRAYAFENLAAENVNWLRRFIRDRLPANSFVIDSASQMLWLACDVPAVTFDILAERSEAFRYHYKRHTFDNCYVVQRMTVADVSTGAWKPLDAVGSLADALTLEPVAQAVYRPNYAVRVSRVTGMNEKAFAAWAEMRRAWLKRQASATASTSTENVTTELPESELRAYSDEWLRNLP